MTFFMLCVCMTILYWIFIDNLCWINLYEFLVFNIFDTWRKIHGIFIPCPTHLLSPWQIFRWLFMTLDSSTKWSGVQHRFWWHKCESSSSPGSWYDATFIMYAILCTPVGVVLLLPGHRTHIIPYRLLPWPLVPPCHSQHCPGSAESECAFNFPSQTTNKPRTAILYIFCDFYYHAK